MDTPEQKQSVELLEARRIRRLEQKRQRTFRRRTVLLILFIILILSTILIVRGCRRRSALPPDARHGRSDQEFSVQTEPDLVVNIAAVGDIMFSEEQRLDALQPDGRYDFAENFAAVSGLTVSADLMLGNLECNFCGEPYAGEPDCRAPEQLADTLAAIGFDVLQTANSRAIQNGISGLQSTIRVLNAAGIGHVGTYESAEDRAKNDGVYLCSVGGLQVAVIAFSKELDGLSLPKDSEYAVNMLYRDYDTYFEKINTDALLSSVRTAKALRPDVILAMLHWGSKGTQEVSASQRRIAQMLFENGVDAIIGSHSHLVGEMKTVDVTTVDGEKKTCFVAYSLGDFYSSLPASYARGCRQSLILNLQFTKNGETGVTALSAVSYTPLYLIDNGEDADCRYEILPIRSAVSSGRFPDWNDTLTAAIGDLRASTASDFDSGR